MGVKHLLFLAIVILLISACSIGKTKPVVTDITGAAVQEPTEETQETTEPQTNETEEEQELNETEEQEETVEEEIPPGTHIITIKDLKLDPQELTIKQGETVIWKHEDTYETDESTRHYIAAHSNEFRSPLLFYGNTFQHTFNNTGTFTYIDIIYKDRKAMRGTIIVE